MLRIELSGKPVDRALLGAFAELVLADGGDAVLEVGCQRCDAARSNGFRRSACPSA